MHALAGSVADEAFLDQVVEFHTATYGATDILVNNAGIGGRLPVGDVTAEFLDAQLAVNIRSVILLTGKCLPLLKAAAICPGLVDTPMADDCRDVVPPEAMISSRDVAEAVRMTTRLSPSCIVPEIILLRPTDWLLPPDA